MSSASITISLLADGVAVVDFECTRLPLLSLVYTIKVYSVPFSNSPLGK